MRQNIKNWINEVKKIVPVSRQGIMEEMTAGGIVFVFIAVIGWFSAYVCALVFGVAVLVMLYHINRNVQKLNNPILPTNDSVTEDTRTRIKGVFCVKHITDNKKQHQVVLYLIILPSERIDRLIVTKSDSVRKLQAGNIKFENAGGNFPSHMARTFKDVTALQEQDWQGLSQHIRAKKVGLLLQTTPQLFEAHADDDANSYIESIRATFRNPLPMLVAYKENSLPKRRNYDITFVEITEDNCDGIHNHVMIKGEV